MDKWEIEAGNLWTDILVHKLVTMEANSVVPTVRDSEVSVTEKLSWVRIKSERTLLDK